MERAKKEPGRGGQLTGGALANHIIALSRHKDKEEEAERGEETVVTWSFAT